MKGCLWMAQKLTSPWFLVVHTVSLRMQYLFELAGTWPYLRICHKLGERSQVFELAFYFISRNYNFTFIEDGFYNCSSIYTTDLKIDWITWIPEAKCCDRRCGIIIIYVFSIPVGLCPSQSSLAFVAYGTMPWVLQKSREHLAGM